MTIVEVDPTPGSDIDRTINSCIQLAADLEAAGVSPTTVLPLVEQARLKFIGVRQNSKPVVVKFAFNGVTIKVAANSDSGLIRRDWHRTICDYITTEVGPHPRAVLTEEELQSDALIEAERLRKIEEQNRERLERSLANTRYLGTPDKDASFLYAPVYSAGNKIDLIAPAHFDHLPKDTQLTSISGRRVTKGVDFIDMDTRGGFIAFGLPSHAQDTIVYEGPFRSE